MLNNPYCTLVEVQKEVRNSEPEASQTIIDAINQASRWIDGHCGRDYFYHNHSVTPIKMTTWDAGLFDEFLFLPYAPIITLTQVSEAGTVLVLDTDFVIKGSRLIRVGGSWLKSEDPTESILITGTFGYLQASATDVPSGIPDNIRKAAVLVAAAFSGFNRKESVGLDGSKSDVIDKTIPKTVYDILGSKRSVMFK